MCGIVGAVARRNITDVLLEGLQRLEYRGYDSAGVVFQQKQKLLRHRVQGKVRCLKEALNNTDIDGRLGIAHTRWATHGEPSVSNAHPHVCRDRAAVVHNGIIENHETLRKQQAATHRFTSQTDTEVIVHAIYDAMEKEGDLLTAVRQVTRQLTGAYALGVIHIDEPGTLIATRTGSPLVIGVGDGENFIASDVYALIQETRQFIYLEEGDIARITADSIEIFDRDGQAVERQIEYSQLSGAATGKAGYRHYMLKEIFEQPQVLADTLEGRLGVNAPYPGLLGPGADKLLNEVRSVQIVACGTSYHAGLVAKYWIESLAGITCQVEVASEYRYRPQVVNDGMLFVTISQSGETADTLAALRAARKMSYLQTLAICNVAESSLVRESDICLLTRAGPEIGVASTKAFTTQLVVLLLLAVILADKGKPNQDIVAALESLPTVSKEILELSEEVERLAQRFGDKSHALFLGRGEFYPVAMEGALKLKEISYIHAEAYPAGELKHGPLALIDREIPVIAVAPNNDLLGKLKANLEEVRARGGQLIVFAEPDTEVQTNDEMTVIYLPQIPQCIAPIAFTLPLQLLAYHVAVLKGTDVDQPRNLAKSVTVE